MVKWIIIGVAAFVLVVGAGAGTVWIMVSRMSAARVEANQDPTKGALDPKAQVIDIGKFVTNLADKDPRYIDVTFSVVVKDAKDAQTLEANRPVIRDVVLTLLASKQSADVTGPDGADALKAAVLERLNEELGSNLIQRILITSIVVQF